MTTTSYRKSELNNLFRALEGVAKGPPADLLGYVTARLPTKDLPSPWVTYLPCPPHDERRPARICGRVCAYPLFKPRGRPLGCAGSLFRSSARGRRFPLAATTGPLSLCCVQAARRGMDRCELCIVPPCTVRGGPCFVPEHGRPRLGAASSQRLFPMKKSEKPVRCKKNPPAWHAAFEAMLPAIETQAQFAFRHLNPDARAEAIQETVCNCCQAYARLVELGKTDVAYPTVLARFGIRQTNEGRKVGGSLNVHDISSDYCQQRKDLLQERLDRHDSEEDAWAEILVEDKHAGPAETAIVRIDFATWLLYLPRRLRKIATFLASGETTTAAAKRFRVSQGRISQIRKELFLAWHRFQGDEPALAIA